jgi:tetratricopeptide (TPR) repeat protein
VDPMALATFRSDLNQWQEAWIASPAYHLRVVDWGRGASETIAAEFSPEWVDQLSSPLEFLRLGFALYDVERYEDALTVFVQHYEEGRESGDDSVMSMAGIWAAHMLDLLGRRDEAVARYGEVKELGRTDTWSHSQYGLQYSFSEYADERMGAPFERIENREG